MIILVVEPEKHYLNQYKTYLEAKGHQVIGALDGKIAIDFISDASIPIDALITAYQMPHAYGLQILEAVAQSERNIPTLLQHKSWQITVTAGKKKLKRFLMGEIAAFPFASVGLKTAASDYIDQFLDSIQD
jgi:DNA-binding response OmpR family regulator